MRWKKRYWSRLFLVLEVMIFFCFYWFGSDGFRNVHKLREEKNILAKEVGELEVEIAQLDKEIVAFEQDSFYREKLAREQFQMARKNEEIYLVVKKKGAS